MADREPEPDPLFQVLDALAQVRDHCPVDETGRHTAGWGCNKLLA